ncbi:SatD family protein [Nocardioides litoris]|uniref:SatD family protein n=1 Tax=Nocardioides litoris TaxID=1926648 RepID=UPI00111C9684|nr:SatD family protein [Nocardioides litoris]
MTVKQEAVVLIGDLVGSRGASDRRALHRRLERALSEVNGRWDLALRVTAGDEYQGVVPSLGTACAVTLAVRLALLPDHDVRHGIGRGARRVLDDETGIEDGSAWWAARRAIDDTHQAAARAATRGARTAYRLADGVAGETGAVDAALLARDELVGRLDDRSLSVLRGLLSGRTQAEVAVELGISPSAVSQRVRSDALGVVVTTDDLLGGLA